MAAAAVLFFSTEFELVEVAAAATIVFLATRFELGQGGTSSDGQHPTADRCVSATVVGSNVAVPLSVGQYSAQCFIERFDEQSGRPPQQVAKPSRYSQHTLAQPSGYSQHRLAQPSGYSQHRLAQLG